MRRWKVQANLPLRILSGYLTVGIRQLLHHAMEWDFCILLSEQDARACHIQSVVSVSEHAMQDYPLRGNEVLATYLWVHHGTSFVSVDEASLCGVHPGPCVSPLLLRVNANATSHTNVETV